MSAPAQHVDQLALRRRPLWHAGNPEDDVAPVQACGSANREDLGHLQRVLVTLAEETDAKGGGPRVGALFQQVDHAAGLHREHGKVGVLALLVAEGGGVDADRRGPWRG